jgi:ArsR family transcriptional regulator
LTLYAADNIFGEVNVLPTDLFAALSHDTRLRCVLLLRAYEELCVCDLTHAIGAPQPHMSRHLAQLRRAGLVTMRKDGLWVHYRINPELPAWVVALLDETAKGVVGLQPYGEDLVALAQVASQQDQTRCA